ncbi:unnamed protein product, partial [Polarella glacialis]
PPIPRSSAAMAATPDQPKQPKTAYWLWLGANREAVSKRVGVTKMSEVAKAAGVEWKGMTPAAKASYEKKATQEKAAYVKALAEFKKAGGTVAGRKSKKTKEGKEGKKVK